jgi:hypothetical protein
MLSTASCGAGLSAVSSRLWNLLLERSAVSPMAFRQYTGDKKGLAIKLALYILVGVQGFEPWTPCSQSRCATGLRHTPKETIIPDASLPVN